MAKQYWIGGFFIDVSRNQITQNNQTQTIPPKALAVLTCLAENQGQVISQEELLTRVWQNTVVSPNTLQRSIAQLRKALGDDGKGQVYIKTHAKQGYSLECDVRWSDNARSAHTNNTQTQTETANTTDTTSQPQAFIPGLRLIAIVATISILGILSYQYLTPERTSVLRFDTLRSLTATDDKEFDANYTPDGQYIVFHRYLDKQCINKIWAKNIATQQEYQLTKDWGAYGSHSFSKDGKELVFLATEACLEPVTQRDCYDLVSLDFEQALASPQEPNVMLQCKNSQVQKPKWLNNDNIALLQRSSNRWKLISYSTSQNESTDLYQVTEGNVIDYAYSPQDDLIAVTSIHSDDQQHIEMLNTDGQVLSSHPIQLPLEISRFRLIEPNFDPLNKQLVFSTGRQLFTLSYEGQVAKINLPNADKMALPEFHPEGNKVLLIKGPYDSDIVQLSLDQISASALAQQAPFERTNLGEDYATFQPDGNLIAFWSERSGEEQVWISDGTTTQQLTSFPVDTPIRGIQWAADGQSLLINANYQLIQVFLDGQQKIHPTEHAVVILFHWDSQNNSTLMLMRDQGILKFVEYNISNSETRQLTDKPVLWAHKSADGRLIYKDTLDQFWQPGPLEPQVIEPLTQQGGKAKAFVMHGNSIYAINKQNQLWSYNLDDQSFTILGEVSDAVDYLTDINQTELLMTIEVSAKKEVVELSLSE